MNGSAFVLHAGIRNWSLFGFVQNDRRCSLKSETLEKMVFIHANTKLIDKIRDDCYEEPSASWELELEQGSEDAEAETEDTDSTPESETE